MTERVEIDVGASTARAVSSLASVGSASVGMASDAIKAVEASLVPWQAFALAVTGVEAAISLAERAVRTFAGPMGRALDLAIQYRGENDSLVRSLAGVDRQIERIGAAFGEIALQGLEATGVVEDLEGFLEGLVDQILDADSAIGQFVRQGLTALVDGVGFVGEAVLQAGAGFVGLVGMINVAREGLVEFGLEAERLVLANQLADVMDRHATQGPAAGGFNLGSQVGGWLATADNRWADIRVAEERALTAQITALDEVIARQHESTQAARESADASIRGIQETIAGYTQLQTAMDQFVAGMSGDANLPDAPPGTGGDGRQGRRRFFGPLGLIFETAPGFEAGLREVAERGARIQDAIGGIFGGIGGGGDGKAVSPLKDGMDDLVATMTGSFQGGLDNMMRGLGRFLAAGGKGFEDFGEGVRDTFSGMLGGIGNSLMSAALAGALSSATGPFGLFGAIGGMFSLAAGLVSGIGGGGGRNRGGGGAGFSDTLNTIRPEVSSSGPTTVVQMSIGAIYSPEESTTAVARLTRRAIATGELGGIGG